MKIFFDTSAFVKRYVFEKGSEKVDSLCYQATEICISILGVTEIISSLTRLLREGKIDKHNYRLIKNSLFSDLETITICNITQSVVDRSINLLEKNALKSLDAFQIACALEINADSFVSGDTKQLIAARKTKMNIINI